MAAGRHAGGRPTEYKPEFCEDLIDHMMKGLSFESFAATIWVNRDTLYEWVKVHPEFSDAKSIGKEQSRLWWESKGQEGLFNKSEYDKDAGTGSSKSMNAALWIFNMKNRFADDWADKQVVDSKIKHTGLNMIFHQAPGCEPLKNPEDADQAD